MINFDSNRQPGHKTNCHKECIAFRIMKKGLVVLICSMLLWFLVADKVFCQQTNYPPGGYTSLKELQNRTPSKKLPYRISLRDNKELTKNGGNDFKAEEQDTVANKWLRDNKVYAVSDSGVLYLNGLALKLPEGFIDVVEEGQFLLFLCSTPRAQKQVVVSLGSSDVMVGGAAVQVVDDAKHIRNKIYYCLDIATGEAKILDKLYLTNKLEKYPDLLAEFSDDPYNTEMEILLKYFRLMNSR